MIRLALWLALLGAPVIQTDGRHLERDYRWPTDLRVVAPAILENQPWEQVEPGVRRRVFFNDRETLVMLEIDKEPDTELKTHYHVHDQITYVLEGRARVQVGDDVREVGPGTVYVAPSNVRHGLLPLTRRFVLVEVFTPTREDFRPGAAEVGPPSENELKSFVYHWFALFDRGAPVEQFLQYLSPDRLEMNFPERTLRSAAEFRDWLAGVRASVPLSPHTVEELKVSGADVDLVVRWRGQRYRQHWQVGPGPTLLRYQVTPI